MVGDLPEGYESIGALLVHQLYKWVSLEPKSTNV